MARLIRKSNDKKLFGVCGALGRYFDIDPVIIRILFLIAAIVFGSGILLYLILAIVIPSE